MDNNEILFWKIIRNIYIFRIIKSFLKIEGEEGLFYYSYDEISRVEWMIENGHLDILRDKVKRNEYLVFNSSFKNVKNRLDTRKKYDFNGKGFESKLNRNGRMNEKTIIEMKYCKYSIFSVFKEDFEFYSILFKNYQFYFQLPNSLKEIERMSIEYDNLASLKVIIEEYNYSPTIGSLIQSFDIGSFKIAFYLYQYFKSNKVQIIENLWNKCVILSSLKLELPLLNKRLEFLFNPEIDIKIPLLQQLSIFKSLHCIFNVLIYNEKLSRLITYYKIIKTLSIHQVSFQSFINKQFQDKIRLINISNRNLIDKEQFSKTIIDIDINNIKFTNVQLNTTISNINNDSQEEKEIIKTLFFTLIKYTSASKETLLNNIIYYKLKYCKDEKSNFLKCSEFDKDILKKLKPKNNTSISLFNESKLKVCGIIGDDGVLLFEPRIYTTEKTLSKEISKRFDYKRLETQLLDTKSSIEFIKQVLIESTRENGNFIRFVEYFNENETLLSILKDTGLLTKLFSNSLEYGHIDASIYLIEKLHFNPFYLTKVKYITTNQPFQNRLGELIDVNNNNCYFVPYNKVLVKYK